MFSAVALLIALATPAPQSLPTIVLHAPKADLTLQVARTQAQRELGLMSVTQLAPHTGMIFVFDTDARVDFWMKDTLVPLDMVFVGSSGRVRSVAPNVPASAPDAPEEAIARRSGDARFVLELPAGEAHADGIAAGTRLNVGLPQP